VLRLEIRGLVQGVGYRAAMVDAARRLGVSGWVRNRRDGSVEALVAGPAAAVEALAAWAAQGPRFARVDRVDRVDRLDNSVAEEVFSGFEQRPTA
jgi:acylphosphatase